VADSDHLSNLIDDISTRIADRVAEKVAARLRPPSAPAAIESETRIAVSAEDAAKLLSISTSTLKRMLREGELTPLKAGARLLIATAELRAWAKGSATSA
jgi:excisionase family DNA binding protein